MELAALQQVEREEAQAAAERPAAGTEDALRHELAARAVRLKDEARAQGRAGRR